MPSHEIANAMSIVMSMAVDVDGCKEADAAFVRDRFAEELKKGFGLSKEDIEAILALTGTNKTFQRALIYEWLLL